MALGLVTPAEAVAGEAAQFIGADKDMSISTAYAKGGLAGVLGWLPLWNTIFLLASSVTVHIAHLGLKKDNRKQFNIWLGATLVLGYLFVFFQGVEYYEAYAHMGLTLTQGFTEQPFYAHRFSWFSCLLRCNYFDHHVLEKPQRSF